MQSRKKRRKRNASTLQTKDENEGRKYGYIYFNKFFILKIAFNWA